MPNHIVTQIRDAAVTACAGLATSGARVYGSRVHRWGGGTLPGLAIYTNDWRVDHALTTGVRGSRRFMREVDLVINAAAAVSSGSDLDDTLDTMMREIEAAMAVDVTLGGVADDSFPVRIITTLHGDGERRVGLATVEYRVWTRTAETAPTAYVA